jgi:hypothetical protein
MILRPGGTPSRLSFLGRGAFLYWVKEEISRWQGAGTNAGGLNVLATGVILTQVQARGLGMEAIPPRVSGLLASL